jgi:hypothetical protein
MEYAFISLPSEIGIETEKNASTNPNGSTIPKVLIRQYVNNYKNLQHDHLQQHTQIGFDTVYVQFNITTLIDYLSAMKNNPDQTKKADGCRIYLGAHDQDATGVDLKSYNNKTTLIFVATQEQTDGSIKELLSNAGLGGMLGFDFGTLCPPSCSCPEDPESIVNLVYGTTPCNQ